MIDKISVASNSDDIRSEYELFQHFHTHKDRFNIMGGFHKFEVKLKDIRYTSFFPDNGIPKNVFSVADLLLFNTTINVYTSSEMADPFDNRKTEARGFLSELHWWLYCTNFVH